MLPKYSKKQFKNRQPWIIQNNYTVSKYEHRELAWKQNSFQKLKIYIKLVWSFITFTYEAKHKPKLIPENKIPY